MLAIGLEKEVDEPELLISKIKEEICRYRIDLKKVFKAFLNSSISILPLLSLSASLKMTSFLVPNFLIAELSTRNQ